MALFDLFAKMAIDAAGGGSSVFGKNPDVAPYTPTDLGASAKKAATSNIANAPEIQALLEKILPGYGEMVSRGSKNTLSLLKGELPQDVKDAIYRSGAYKSLMGGSAGSGMSKNLVARDIGRTSLDLVEAGTNSAQRWAGLTQAGFSPFTITAPMQGEMDTKNNLYTQATKQFQFNVDAAPDPAAAGLFNTIGVIGGTAASFGMGSALQGMGGGRTAAVPVTAGGGSGGNNNAVPVNPYFQWGSYGG